MARRSHNLGMRSSRFDQLHLLFGHSKGVAGAAADKTSHNVKEMEARVQTRASLNVCRYLLNPVVNNRKLLTISNFE